MLTPIELGRLVRYHLSNGDPLPNPGIHTLAMDDVDNQIGWNIQAHVCVTVCDVFWDSVWVPIRCQIKEQLEGEIRC